MKGPVYILVILLSICAMLFFGCGEDEDDATSHTSIPTEYERPVKEIVDPVIDDYVDEDIELFLDDLRDVEKTSIADALEAKIARARGEISRFGVGHVVVGRVVVDGPVDPRLVFSQMAILAEGYFATAIKEYYGAVGFRLNGYAPYELRLEGEKKNTGSITNVGTIYIESLPEAEMASVWGRIILEGNVDPASADVHLNISVGFKNTPHNGIEGREIWPEPIQATILPSGEFFAEGLTPAKFTIYFDHEDHVKQWQSIFLNPGQELDIGTIRLEVPKKIKLTYYVSREPLSDNAEMEQVVIDAGTRWKTEENMFGWDLEFKQEEDVIHLNWSYGPCSIAEVGSGEVVEFLEPPTGRLDFVNPRGLKPKDDHIYLLDQTATWGHWVLFKFEIMP